MRRAAPSLVDCAETGIDYTASRGPTPPISASRHSASITACRQCRVGLGIDVGCAEHQTGPMQPVTDRAFRHPDIGGNRTRLLAGVEARFDRFQLRLWRHDGDDRSPDGPLNRPVLMEALVCPGLSAVSLLDRGPGCRRDGASALGHMVPVSASSSPGAAIVVGLEGSVGG